LYMEGAAARFSIFVETSYLHFDPDVAPVAPLIGRSAAAVASPAGSSLMNLPQPASGFGDLVVGSKALLLDSELVQTTFQFKTFIPTGDFTKGLGTGHVSLEPSLLAGVRLNHATYLQGQLAYWIPIGGDRDYQGNVFHAHASLNHVLWCPSPGWTVVGTLEASEWTVLNGLETATDFLLPVKGKLTPVATDAKTSMLSAGPGIRLFICDKIDFGAGSQFALTNTHWEGELFRVEFRWRF
jgi:hypothetical protein